MLPWKGGTEKSGAVGCLGTLTSLGVKDKDFSKEKLDYATYSFFNAFLFFN